MATDPTVVPLICTWPFNGLGRLQQAPTPEPDPEPDPEPAIDMDTKQIQLTSSLIPRPGLSNGPQSTAVEKYIISGFQFVW